MLLWMKAGTACRLGISFALQTSKKPLENAGLILPFAVRGNQHMANYAHSSILIPE